MKTAVFNFSGVYGEEGFPEWLREQGAEVAWIDCSDVEGTHCYCDAAAQRMLLQRMEGEMPKLRWIDSGDYHYLSHLLALRESAPFHLVLLDHHADDQAPAFGGVLSCGSWVKAMREENPMLRDVLTIGPEAAGEPETPEDWSGRREGERVYISLDKDVMSREWARTDWTQGDFSLAQVKDILYTLMRRMDVAAVDICGEFSLNQGAAPEDLRVNLATNGALYQWIDNHIN